MGNPLNMVASMHGDSVKPPRNPMMQMVAGFANGGAIGKVIDAIQKRSDTLRDIDSGSNQSAPPEPVQPKPSMGSDADNYAAQAAQIEAEQQATAKAHSVAKPKSFLNKLGFKGGGKIEGRGTPTSDSIDATVQETGDNIKVSTKERIVSAAQDAFLEKLAADLGFPNLDALLEQGTGQPVGPTMRDGTPAAAYGASDDDLKSIAANPLDRILSGAATSMPKGTGGMSSMDYSTTPAKPMAQPMQIAASASNPLTQSTRDYSLPEGSPVPFVPRQQSAAAVQEKPVYSQPRAAFQADDMSMKAADPRGYATVSGQQPGAQERTFGAASPATVDPAQTVSAEAVPSNPLLRGDFSPASVPSAPSANATGTPARPGRTNSFSEKDSSMDARNPLTTIDESLAKANSIRDSIGNDGTGPKVTMLGNSGRAETQNLMDKWDRENQARSTTQEIGRNPRAANALAGLFSSGLSAETQQRGQDVRQQTDMTVNAANNETNRRGQDVTLRTRLAEMAGNPLDNALKQTQTAAIQSGLDDKKRTAAIMEEMQNPATTPERRKALLDSVLAPLGKTANDNMRENFMAVGGGQEYDQAAGVMRNVPQRLIDLRTGKVVGSDGWQPSTAAQPLPPKNQLKVGQTYQTGRGPAVWNGTGFDQA